MALCPRHRRARINWGSEMADYSLVPQDPASYQSALAAVMRGKQRAAQQEQLAAAGAQTRQFDTLASVAPLMNNPGAVRSSLQAQKNAQGYAPVQMGNTGFMIPGTGEFVESPMYADEKQAGRDSALSLTRERLAAQRDIAGARIDQQREAAEQRNALAQTMAALRAQGLSQTAEYQGLRIQLERDRLAAAKEKDADKAEKAAKGKTLPSGEVAKIADKENIASGFADLVTGFKDEFSGTPGAAGLQNTLGKYQPLGIGKQYGDQSNWWQNYNDRKNLVRNQLFGSALTKPEQEAFDRANINEGMAPAEIKRRLDQQAAAVAKAVTKRLENFKQAGYDVSGFSVMDVPKAALPGAPRTGPSDDELINKYLPKSK